MITRIEGPVNPSQWRAGDRRRQMGTRDDLAACDAAMSDLTDPAERASLERGSAGAAGAAG